MSVKNQNKVTKSDSVQQNDAVQSNDVQNSSVAPTAEAPLEKKAVRRAVESFDISNPDETMHLANDLARFISENKLFHNIQGKEYVNVEGWQYAGSRLGILPIVEDLGRLESADASEIKYQAKVKLFDLRSSQIVGTGFAICSNKEATKRYYQEFAIASMAQTRAIGKAYRNILAWIIRAAGYEPTPAEEMDYTAAPVAQPSVAQPNATEKQTVQQLNSKPEPAYPQVAKAQPVPTPEKVENTAGEEAESAPITISQKTQILLLLNNSVITKDEKEKMVVKINTFDTIRAEKAIEKLKKVIQERTSTSENGMAA